MSFNFTDTKKWTDEYKTASEKERYESLLAIIGQDLPEKFIEETDLGMYFLETIDTLIANNLMEETFDLINKIKDKHPEIYKKDFQYFDKITVSYYLFKHETDKVREALTSFMQNPVQAIEEMFVILDELLLYGCTDIAVELCKKIYEPVKLSDEILEGTEHEIAEIIFIDMVDKYYQKVRNNEKPDWEKFMTDVNTYEIIVKHDLKHYLLEKRTLPQDFETAFKKGIADGLGILFWEFFKYSSDNKKMNFLCSKAILEGLFDFLYEINSNTKTGKHPDKFFNFTEDKFDQYLGQLFGGFLSQKRALTVGILWGTPYLYDFLLSNNIITDSVYKNVITIINSLKSDLMENLENSLWQYDFVHRWIKPDGIDQKEFEAEAKKFAVTINVKIPLSDEESGQDDFFDMLTDSDFVSLLEPQCDKKEKSPKKSKKKKTPKKNTEKSKK